jgi:REP element-mobilizing transposase RayT
MHRAQGLFAHITWHTWRRTTCIRSADAEVVAQAILDAAVRTEIHVLAQAVLANHVHVLVSFTPDRALTPFIRDAKSESSRRVSQSRPAQLRWARGYYAGSISHSQIPATRTYLANQFLRHPDLIPVRVD